MTQHEHVCRLVTEKCLIAADVDQTILSQTKDRQEERLNFFRRIAPELAESARLRVHVGFITGNSMHELCSRFLDSLVEHLCNTGDLPLITRFHFFWNSGGIYFHFPSAVVEQVIQRTKGDSAERLRRNFWHAIIASMGSELRVQSQFVDSGYVQRSLIPSADSENIELILQKACEEYWQDLNTNLTSYAQRYDLSWVSEQDGSVPLPKVELRSATYRLGAIETTTTVQITLKTILSFRQALPGYAKELFGNDLRSMVVKKIQDRIDRAGFGQYVVRPGGRGSIDVTLERLDKAYALEFLIDHLRLQGNTHRGQLFGSNAIYLGDEVMVGGGNDYPVTRIPGLLVFAVNRDRELVPFRRDVFVPSAIFEGPDATAGVLTHFNDCARRLLREYREDRPMKTAIEALKEEIFVNRITEKIGRLRSLDISVEEWQTLHTFVTLIARDDLGAKQWLSLLVKQLDEIMTQMASNPGRTTPMAPGSSHPDSK